MGYNTLGESHALNAHKYASGPSIRKLDKAVLIILCLLMQRLDANDNAPPLNATDEQHELPRP